MSWTKVSQTGPSAPLGPRSGSLGPSLGAALPWYCITQVSRYIKHSSVNLEECHGSWKFENQSRKQTNLHLSEIHLRSINQVFRSVLFLFQLTWKNTLHQVKKVRFYFAFHHFSLWPVSSGVQRSGDARGGLLDCMPPYQILVLSSSVWWSLLLDICHLWRHNMTSYSRLQTTVLPKCVDATCILYYTHSPYSLFYNLTLYWT